MMTCTARAYNTCAPKQTRSVLYTVVSNTKCDTDSISSGYQHRHRQRCMCVPHRQLCVCVTLHMLAMPEVAKRVHPRISTQRSVPSAQRGQCGPTRSHSPQAVNPNPLPFLPPREPAGGGYVSQISWTPPATGARSLRATPNPMPPTAPIARPAPSSVALEPPECSTLPLPSDSDEGAPWKM